MYELGFVSIRKFIPETGCDTIQTASDDVTPDFIADPLFNKFKEIIINDSARSSLV